MENTARPVVDSQCLWQDRWSALSCTEHTLKWGKTRMDKPAILVMARRHLSRRDPRLGDLIAAIGPCTLRYEPDRFAALVRSIVSQQISTKAAAAIHARLQEAVGAGGVSAARILELSDEQLRGAGLSINKMLALRDLATKVHQQEVLLAQIHDLEDEEVIRHLVPVRGIGRWTAEMFLIFSLGRLDILPVDDLGLRMAAKRIYGLRKVPEKARLTKLAEPWRPFRSVATWYLWRSLGFVPQSGLKVK